MTVQLVVGLILTTYAATRGGESVTKCRLQFLPTSILLQYSSGASYTDPTSGLYNVRFQDTGALEV